MQERYVLRRHIGSGRTTEVWQAWDERLSRAVAVKLVSAQPPPEAGFSHRFQDEARAAAAVLHPHIVIIYDCDEIGGQDGPAVPYIVMEFLEGETLADRIRRGALPVGEAVRVCAQIADALTAAHSTGVAHGDLKPANVFLTPEGVKVLDFGLARAERAPAAGMWSGPAEPPRGTSAYLAPEERLGSSPTMAAAADVYALGVMLTEALTGRRALDASLPEGIPVEVAVLCSRCRARDPAARPSAADVTEILTASSGSPAEDPPPSPRQEQSWFSRPRTGRAPEAGRAVREGPGRSPVPAEPPPPRAGPPPVPPAHAPTGRAPAPAGTAWPSGPGPSPAPPAPPPTGPAPSATGPAPSPTGPRPAATGSTAPPAGPAPTPTGPPSSPADPTPWATGAAPPPSDRASRPTVVPPPPAGPPSPPAGTSSPPAGTSSPPAGPPSHPAGPPSHPAGAASSPASPAFRPAGVAPRPADPALPPAAPAAQPTGTRTTEPAARPTGAPPRPADPALPPVAPASHLTGTGPRTTEPVARPTGAAPPAAGPAALPADPGSSPGSASMRAPSPGAVLSPGSVSSPAVTAEPPADSARPRRPADPVWPPADGRTAQRVPTGMTGEFTIRLERPDDPPGDPQPLRHRWAPRHSGPAPQAHRHLSQEHLAPPGTPRPEPVEPAAEEPELGRRSHPRLRRFLFDGTLTVTGCAVTILLLSAVSAHRRSPDPPADPAVSRPAGRAAAPSASAGPLAREIAALTKIPPIIQRGLAAGEIRSDVALDLTNVITNLQNDLVAGQRTDPRQGVTELQTKITTRLREGGLTQGRAAELNLALSAVSPRQAALPGAPYPDRR
ncbi:protein kinase domain-containing protein [Actinomadura scrupuli]|uniref:serine/threonine-protein kinase n=1 Tax=Actinomadura scrupuli TaxID=559629 RepID=UPI003D9873F4